MAWLKHYSLLAFALLEMQIPNMQQTARLIAQSIGYPAVFATSLLFAASGLYLLSRRVKEPRHLEKTESVVAMPEVP